MCWEDIFYIICRVAFRIFTSLFKSLHQLLNLYTICPPCQMLQTVISLLPQLSSLYTFHRLTLSNVSADSVNHNVWEESVKRAEPPLPKFLVCLGWAELAVWSSELAGQTNVLHTTRKFQIIRGPSSEQYVKIFVGNNPERLGKGLICAVFSSCNVNALCVQCRCSLCNVQFKGIVHNFFLSFKSHILDSNGVWYSWFCRRGL